MNEGTIQKLLGNKDAPATITYAHMLKKGRTSHGRANLLHRRALPAYYHHQNLGGGIGFFFLAVGGGAISSGECFRAFSFAGPYLVHIGIM
ncbi:MAG: hypothetical protein ACR2G4_17625 [Pyrinomonadaceae bacterium]